MNSYEEDTGAQDISAALGAVSGYRSPENMPKFGLVPADEFCVSMGPDGQVLSTFGESIWDLTPYHVKRNKTLITFPFWKNEELNSIERLLNFQARWLLFSIIQGAKRRPLKTGTLDNYASTLRTLAAFALERSLSIMNVLSNRDAALEYLAKHPAQSIRFRILVDKLRMMASVTPHLPAMSTKDLRVVSATIKLIRTEEKQHAPIPFRILSFMIKNLVDFLTDYEAVEEGYLEVVRLCAADTITGRSFSSQEKSWLAGKSPKGQVGESLVSLLTRFNVIEFFRKYHINVDMKGLARGLMKVRTAVKCLAHIFSGMRDDEVNSLSTECTGTAVVAGREHFLIFGDTTKLAPNGTERVTWVTSQVGHWAIERQRKISQLIYEHCESLHLRLGKHQYLFVAPSYHPIFDGSFPGTDHITYAGVKSDRSGIEEFIPRITEEDLQQLESIDTTRPWRNEKKFAIGEIWPYVSHQARRSLALYGHKSGLISSPSLQLQLKHIIDSMSLYYAKGSFFADKVIGGNSLHFGSIWRNEQALHEALSYQFNVVDKVDELFGPHVNFINASKKNSGSVLSHTREITFMKFKKGEIAYRETALGGCVALTACEDMMLSVANVDCLAGCVNFIGSKAKLQTLIKAQEALVQHLDLNSVEYRTEHRQLSLLKKGLTLTKEATNGGRN